MQFPNLQALNIFAWVNMVLKINLELILKISLQLSVNNCQNCLHTTTEKVWKVGEKAIKI